MVDVNFVKHKTPLLNINQNQVDADVSNYKIGLHKVDCQTLFAEDPQISKIAIWLHFHFSICQPHIPSRYQMLI